METQEKILVDSVNDEVLDELSEEEETKEEHKNNKKKKTRYFETYISKVLKNITPENGITANAKQQLNSAVCIFAKIVSDKVSHLTTIAKKKTMSVKEVENATNLLLTGKLLSGTIAHGAESIEKFESGETKHSSRQDKAGILFPPSIAEKFLRNFGLSKIMVTKTTPVYFASVLEYFVIQILVNASRIAKENNRVRLTIRDLELAVRTDLDLSILFGRCKLSFVGGGVLPQIHESLLNKKPRKKRKNTKVLENSSSDVKKGHRFRPGTVSLREIRKFQKVSNCLTFAKFPFERLVRGIVNKYKSDMKISKEVFIIIQYYIEQFVVDLLRDSNSAAIHSGRVKLMSVDITFITGLRRYQAVDTAPYKVEKKQEEQKQEEKET